MKVTYELKLRVLASALLESVAKLEEDINSVLSGIGQEMHVTSVLPLTVTTDRELTEEEMDLYSKALLEQCTKKFGKTSIESFRLIGREVPEDFNCTSCGNVGKKK